MISNELREHLSKIENLTLVSEVGFQTIKGLRVFPVNSLTIAGLVHSRHLRREAVRQRVLLPLNLLPQISDRANTLCEQRNQRGLCVLRGMGLRVRFLASFDSSMLRNLDSSRYPSIPDCQSVGSPIISRVLRSVRPRYHFAASMVLSLPFSHLEHLLRARALPQQRWHHYAAGVSGSRPRGRRQKPQVAARAERGAGRADDRRGAQAVRLLRLQFALRFRQARAGGDGFGQTDARRRERWERWERWERCAELLLVLPRGAQCGEAPHRDVAVARGCDAQSGRKRVFGLPEGSARRWTHFDHPGGASAEHAETPQRGSRGDGEV